MRLTIRSTTAILLVLLLALTLLPLAGCAGADDTTTPATDSGDPENAREEADTEVVTGGDALIDAKCTRCHSRIQVDNAQKTREEWEATVERMVRNGADLTDAERAEIIEYLSGE